MRAYKKSEYLLALRRFRESDPTKLTTRSYEAWRKQQIQQAKDDNLSDPGLPFPSSFLTRAKWEDWWRELDQWLAETGGEVPEPEPVNIEERISKDIDEEVLRGEIRELKRETAEYRKREAGIERAIGVIRDTIAPINEIALLPPRKRRPVKKRSPEEMTLLLSCAHFGKVTPSYDSTVAAWAVMAVFDKLLSVLEIERHGKDIRTLNLLVLGDIIDGMGIFPTQAHESDTPCIIQVRNAAETIRDVGVRAARNFDTVRIHFVPSNHGRISKFHDPRDNWDAMLGIMVEEMFRDNDRVEVTAHWQHMIAATEILGWKFLMTHGHQINMWMNIPDYGIRQKLMRWATAFHEKKARLTQKKKPIRYADESREVTQALHEIVGNFDVMCMAHFHICEQLEWNGYPILLNGTLIEDDEWALNRLGMAATPGQWLFTTHRKRPIVATWMLEAEDESGVEEKETSTG